METIRATNRMKVYRIDHGKRLIYLGKTFMATLDGGKNRFPKHVNDQVRVLDEELFTRFIKDVQVGDDIEFTAVTNLQTFVTDLESFVVIRHQS